VILFLGIPSEPPLALAIAAARRQGLRHLVANQRQSQEAELELEMIGGRPRGRLRFRDEATDLEQVTGVLVRLMDAGDLPENQPRPNRPVAPGQIERSAAFHAALSDWLEVAPCLVMNRASASASNLSKPFQAQIIRRSGLLTPPTLISNDPDRVRAFQARHGRVIFKSISAVRSIVRELTPASAGRLELVHALPTQFQAYVEGVDVRVHVVGQSVFASEVVSSAIDYRYASRDGLEVEMRPIDLPDDCAARCVALAASLRLPLCGIDLRRTPQGVFYCFEVNPCPAYSYYQEHTGQPIAEAIVELLASGPAAPARREGGCHWSR
jgi:glutathione synthase/RimK-type ligase-like ATP-grasp enzyme